MKIALNATIATKSRTGTGHYAANLTTALMQLDHDHEWVIYCNADMRDWFADRRNGHLVEINSIKFQTPSQRIFWEQTQLSRHVKKHGVDVLHALAFTLPYFNPVRTVITVHDLSFRRYPEMIPLAKRVYYQRVFGRAIKQASRIIVPTETIRTEFNTVFGLPEKVVAVTEAIAPEFVHPPSEKEIKATCGKFGIDAPYFLTVGTLEPRKNLVTLTQALDMLRKERTLFHRLVVVGRPGWINPTLKKLLRESNDVVLMGYVAQEHMPALYAGASLFLFPSFYEGFGLPLLEAFACGVPVLASDIPVHREVCDDAALFLNPHNPEDWKQGILKLLSDAEMQRKLIAKGFERVKQFSWKQAAEKTLEVYKMDGIHVPR